MRHTEIHNIGSTMAQSNCEQSAPESKTAHIDNLVAGNGGEVPQMLKGLVEDIGGTLKLTGMSNSERALTNKWLNSEIDEDARDFAQNYSIEERLAFLQFGSTEAGFTKQNLDKFFQGQQFQNPPKVNFTIEAMIRSTKIPTDIDNIEGVHIVQSKLQILKSYAEQYRGSDFPGYREIIDTINQRLATLPGQTNIGKAGMLKPIDSGASVDAINSALEQMMSSREGLSVLIAALNSSKYLGHGGVPTSHG